MRSLSIKQRGKSMAIQWYRKASVQTAIVSAIALIVVTFLVQLGPKTKLEEEIGVLNSEIVRLRGELAPFKAVAIQRFGGTEQEALTKLSSQLTQLQTEFERTAKAVRKFDARIVLQLSGLWKSGEAPTLSKLVRVATQNSDIKVQIGLKGAELKLVEFHDSSPPRITASDDGTRTLDYMAHARPGSWILGTNRDDLELCGELEAALYGFVPDPTVDGKLWVNSAELTFFVDGIATYRATYADGFAAEIPSEADEFSGLKVQMKGPSPIVKTP